MGFRGSTTAELVFDDCRVPAQNMVGEENRGVAVVMSGLDLERAIVAMINLGMAERALTLALDYAKTREQFGQKIGAFQLVQGKLADMYTTVETMRKPRTSISRPIWRRPDKVIRVARTRAQPRGWALFF